MNQGNASKVKINKTRFSEFAPGDTIILSNGIIHTVIAMSIAEDIVTLAITDDGMRPYIWRGHANSRVYNVVEVLRADH